MKIYINSELTIENGDVKVTIEEFLRQLPHVLKGEFVYINFDHQNETSNTNIDEIELIKSFSNLNFIYASLYNIDSRKIPSIISSSEFEEMIKKLKEDELEIIKNHYINHNNQFVLKTKIPEFCTDIRQFSDEKLFEIIKNDGFHSYIRTNMRGYFVFSRNLKHQNYVMRLLFASKEIKIKNNLMDLDSSTISIENFLKHFQHNLLMVLHNFTQLSSSGITVNEEKIIQ